MHKFDFLRRAILPVLAIGLCSLPSVLKAEVMYALDSRVLLVRFDSSNPAFVDSVRTIRGLQAGEAIMGIDFRPMTGQLYGLGSTSRIYTIDPQTAVATAVGQGPFAPRLEGREFGFDFNPTVDRIRVVSNTGQNLRLHPETGQVAATDQALNMEGGAKPAIIGSGYTNSVRGATTTTLYGVDSETRNLVTQAPPNDGKLNIIGRLQIDFSDVSGFDISPATGLAYMAARVRGSNASVLYQVNLMTADVSLLGLFEGYDQISGLAVGPAN